MYADVDYYKNSYKGNIIPDGELENKLEAASDKIDGLTYNRIIGIGFENLTPFQQEKVKKAVCTYADFMYQYGDYLNFPLNGFVAGSIQVNFNPSGSSDIRTNEAVISYLKQTGLTNRVL